MLELSQARPLISVKEARKLLGSAATPVTDVELETMILESEQVLRFIFKQYLVRNDEVV